MKKFLNVLLVVCFIVPCFFMITACNQNDPNNDKNALAQIAGRYSTTYYQHGDYMEMVLSVSKDGKYSLTQTELDGVSSSVTTVDGFMTVDKNKNITSMTVNDLTDMLSGGDRYFLGNKLEVSLILSSAEGVEIEFIGNMMAEAFKNCIKFKNGYVFIADMEGSNAFVLYKDGQKKLSENDMLALMTTKDMYAISNAMSLLSSSKVPVYEYDMYLLQNESFDATNTEHMADLIDEVEANCRLYYINKFGEAEYSGAQITKVENFNVATAGNGTGKVTFKVADKEYVVEVTYKVVESDNQKPENEIWAVELDVEDKLSFVEQGTELTTLGWELECSKYLTSSRDYVEINDVNCTGDNKVVTISGYDKTKTGYQVVTFTYRGLSCKQSIFVYSDTVNPLVGFDVNNTTFLTIKKSATATSVDYSTLEFTLTYASEKTESKEYSELNADDISLVNAVAFDKYETGDKVIVKYNYKYEEKTYTFYDEVVVNVVNE